MKNFYAYVHARPDGSIFYVGKGSGKRASFMRRRGNYHQHVIDKHGAENILVGRLLCSTEKIAFELERGLIKCLRGAGVRLANNTDGGEGTSGYKHTEDVKRKLAEAATGASNKFFGKKRPEHAAALRGKVRPEQAERMRAYFANRPPNWISPMLGVPATETRKENMRKSCLERGLGALNSKRFKGIAKSNEQRAKMAASATGHVWLSKDECRTHCSEEKALLLEAQGWKRGKK